MGRELNPITEPAYIADIRAQVDQITNAQVTAWGVMTLGSFIKALANCNQDADISFDFAHFVPNGLDSYRGYYDHLAFGIKQLGYVDGVGEECKVRNIYAVAKDAVGGTFVGYKGGDFVMDEDAPLWASNYGEWSQTGIVGIDDHGSTVIIRTAHCES